MKLSIHYLAIFIGLFKINFSSIQTNKLDNFRLENTWEPKSNIPAAIAKALHGDCGKFRILLNHNLNTKA